MYSYSFESTTAEELNDYMVDNYVYRALSRYSFDIWNVYHNIRDKLSHTNNATEGYNYRISTVFSPHLHIYEVIRRLKDEYEFQHHKSEEAQDQVRKSLCEEIDNELLELMEQFEKKRLSPTQLAIESGKTVKIKKGKR